MTKVFEHNFRPSKLTQSFASDQRVSLIKIDAEQNSCSVLLFLITNITFVSQSLAQGFELQV